MKAIQRILCATDFSDAATDAFRYAERLAKSANAELVVLHAFDVPKTLDYAGQTQPADPLIQERLNAVCASAHVPVTGVLHAGAPGEVICWVAQSRECDLIVTATHGHTGLAHLLFGSVTEYVLRHARCPVLTVRQRTPDEPPLAEPLVLPVKAPRFM